MDPITDLGIPILTIFVMWVVGLELAPQDFARVARLPKKLVVATATQTLLLPVIAFGVIAVLEPPLHHTLGLIVIAGCPGGAFSNFFTALARAETALSVALTTTCTLVAVFTLPLVTTVGFALFVDTAVAVQPPVVMMIGQLLVLLVLPVLVGMALRRWRGELFGRLHPILRRLGVSGLVALIAWIAVDRAADIAAELVPGIITASFFILPAMALGELSGRVARMPAGERLAYVVELGFRNLGLATVVTVTLLRQPGFLPFATVFFVTACGYALAVVASYRLRH